MTNWNERLELAAQFSLALYAAAMTFVSGTAVVITGLGTLLAVGSVLADGELGLPLVWTIWLPIALCIAVHNTVVSLGLFARPDRRRHLRVLLLSVFALLSFAILASRPAAA